MVPGKQRVRHALCEKLRAKGVLPAICMAEEGEGNASGTEQKGAQIAEVLTVSVEPEPVPVVSGMTTENLGLSLRIKEEENRNKELEVQVMHLRNRALELEKAETPIFILTHKTAFMAPVGRSLNSVQDRKVRSPTPARKSEAVGEREMFLLP